MGIYSSIIELLNCQWKIIKIDVLNIIPSIIENGHRNLKALQKNSEIIKSYI